jgi:tetratricopeptide (TPR) repeat protein
MAGIFLSYARSDAAKARSIATALEKSGHSVWWDLHVRGGAQFAKVIDEALKAADAVVVLWTAAAVESPWVRDEAAAGRDSGRLIPVSLDGTEPPLGFRQFQTIDLSGWTGRGKVPRLADILSGLDSKVDDVGTDRAGAATAIPLQTSTLRKRFRRSWLIPAAIAFLVIATAGFGVWRWLGASNLPVVEVAAGDPSTRSTAAANDLFVKLGSLAQLADGKWQLLDSSEADRKPDLLFRTSDTSSPKQATASLMLFDGKHNSLLWSREFTLPASAGADLKQQLSLTAGRVLACALESRDQGRLSADLLKTFLDACASLADVSGEDYGPVTAQLRRIVDRVPTFKPAWSRLIMSESTALEYVRFTDAFSPLKRQLTGDANRARSEFPELPELAVAGVRLRDKIDYGRDIDELSTSVERAPANPLLLSELSNALLKVGRMADAVGKARRAAELDPLSPGGMTTYIMTLAHAGQLESARNELGKAEKLWAGTGSLRDAQTAFHVRYGDPTVAMRLDPEGYNTAAYQNARANPSPATISKFKSGIDEFRPKSVTADQVGWAIQGLGEFGFVDDVYYWLGRLPDDQIAAISYLLFRPALASVRRDRRFMPLAKRIGLVNYWQRSGNWPDYCSRPGISYDCKAEAAKLQ